MKKFLSEEEQALEAYSKHFKRKGITVYDQPSNLVEIIGTQVILSNVRGILARYNLKTRRLSFKNLD